MAKPFSQKYAAPTFQNPSDNMDYRTKRGINLNEETEKIQKSWYLDKARYVYSSYLRGDCYIPYSLTKDFAINRLYAQGMQPIEKYRNLLTIPNKQNPQAARKGWMNISWDILPVLPKFRAIILGKFEDIDYNIMVRAIDQESAKTRDEAKLTVMIENKHGKLLKQFRDAIGKEPDPELQDAQLPYIPKTMEELEMMSQLGALKLSWEVSMDKLNNDTHMKVNWPEVKRRLMEDAVDLGFIAVKDFQDPQTNLPNIRYVDPENLIIRQTRHNDFFDVTEAGEVCWYTMEDLRSFGISEDEIRIAALNYQNQWGNPSVLNSFPNQGNPNWNAPAGIKAAVLDLEFQSFDRQFFEGRTEEGKERIYEMPHGSTKGSKKQNRFYSTNKPKFYRAKWVVGTDIIFDYGLQYDVPYQQKTKAKSSYSCYRINSRSMINQSIAIIDDFQLKVYKLRNAVATSRPAGLMIEWGSISNISMGGEKLSSWDVMKIYDDRGDLIYKMGVNPANGMAIQGTAPPIIPMKGGIGPYMDELLRGMASDMDHLRGTTGLNEIVDASSPSPGALVGTAKIAEAATNHVLRPMLTAYKSVKQRCFANITNRWQIVAKFYPQDVSVSINNAAFEVIKITSRLYDPVFDTYCDAIISDDDKMKIENAMAVSMQAAKTGSIGITLKDYFYLQQQIATGNIRWAWVYLGYREEQMQKVAAMASAATQAQIGEQTMQHKQLDIQGQMELIAAKGNEDRKTLAVKYSLERGLVTQQAQAQPPQPGAR